MSGRQIRRTHDLIVHFVVIVGIEDLRVGKDLMKQVFLVSCYDLLRSHCAVLGLKDDVHAGILVDWKVLTWLIVVHVDLPKDQFEDVSIPELFCEIGKGFENLIGLVVVMMEEDHQFLLQVLPVEKIGIQGPCVENSHPILIEEPSKLVLRLFVRLNSIEDDISCEFKDDIRVY